MDWLITVLGAHIDQTVTLWPRAVVVFTDEAGRLQCDAAGLGVVVADGVTVVGRLAHCLELESCVRIRSIKITLGR